MFQVKATWSGFHFLWIKILAFLGLFSISFSQTISLTGSVKNNLGQAIEGARLILVNQKMSAVTNLQGKYAFEGTASSHINSKSNRNLNLDRLFHLSPGLVEINLKSREWIDIGLYSIAGEKIATLQKGFLAVGNHQVKFDHKAITTRCLFMSLVIGTQSYTLLVSPVTSTAAGPILNQTMGGFSLAKSSAISIDSISISAKGYFSKIIPVNNYIGVIDIVLSPIPTYTGTAIIDSIYFAQTHVLAPEDSLFKLVGNRETLIKAHVISPLHSLAPQVYAVLNLNGKTLNLKMDGPDTLPISIPRTPGVVEHTFKNSFTAFLPREWVQPGLKVTVEAGSKSRMIESLKIGAPTEVLMTMFDVHFFALAKGDYPKGWAEEIEAKWPVAKLKLQRIPNIIFSELVIPPRANVPAVKINSKADYKVKTGLNFDGEQSAALMWNGALRMAAGTQGRMRLHFINIYGAGAGGQGGGFGGVGAVFSEGILHHELGHALSLPHWGDNLAYPYKGEMFSIKPPLNYKDTHVGPTWAFDLPTRTFIPPTVQVNSVGGVPGTYKMDPMQGGGVGDQEKGFIFRHFSDYSVFKMQGYLENHVVVWNEALKSYASWNQPTNDYSKLVTNDGVKFPLERNMQVYSLMAGASAVLPQTNLVYPPIGPYESGIIKLFDPNILADRTLADTLFCPTGGCDVTLRVTQGGKVRNYLLPIPMDLTVDSLAWNSHLCRAINVPASEGAVTHVDLLSSPDAEKVGLPAIPTVLDSWPN